jgi:hypothetical protein
MYVGRWSIPNINSDDTQIYKIFDRNNVDHCGSCVNKNVIENVIENVNKNVIKNTSTKIIKIEEKDNK